MLLRAGVFCGFLISLSGQNLSLGIAGGGSLTDAFGPRNDGGVLSYSQTKDFVIGGMLEYRLPWNFAVEVDGLYRELHLTQAFLEPNGTLNSVSPAPVVTWEFPALGKYRFHGSRLRPFVEAGPAFRTTGNLNARPSHYGVAAGVGVEMHWRSLDIAPVVRYTRWARDNHLMYGPQSKSDQVELLLEVSRRSEIASHPMGPHFSVGAIVGMTLIHDFPSSVSTFDTTILIPTPGGGYTLQPASGTEYFSGMNSFIAGPAFELSLPKRFYVEADALHHPLRSSSRNVLDDGTKFGSFSGTEAVTWEFPVLAKYKFDTRFARPFLEAGPSFRLPQNEGGPLSTHGITAGAGVEARWRKLKIAPGIRFTHWGQQGGFGDSVARNQVEFLTALLL
jgi:hypothetical protein